MDWIHNLLVQFGALDEGVRNATYGALGGIFVWLLERFRRKKPDSSRIVAEVPRGQTLNISVGAPPLP